MSQMFLRSTTSDGLTLQGLLSKSDKNSKDLILHIHGMAGNFYENKFLDEMAKVYTDNGFNFLSVNTRGHDFIADFPIAGNKEEYKRVGNFREVFEECILDLESWMETAKNLGFVNVILQGYSLGAVKIVYYLAKTQDETVSKLVLVSPPDMVGLAEEDKKHQDYLKLSKKMVTEGKGNEILSLLIWDWYYLTAKTYLDFGLRGNPIDVFNTYDRKTPSVLSKIKVPVFAILGSNDDAAIIPVSEALEVIKSKTTNSPKFDSTIIEGATHSYFGHEAELANTIANWLKS